MFVFKRKYVHIIKKYLGVDCVVPTVGGRYDVHLNARVKSSVYFDADDLQVRRGTWFFVITHRSINHIWKKQHKCLSNITLTVLILDNGKDDLIYLVLVVLYLNMNK
ncbi:hypothetical protein CEXT_117201 [Caerostris extrusa]|uniref:Uncharacterized protein n=1 Tax=Caerostris extrusa TaxID=172846 RepID=A0AAV4QP40_CAEEX|nr:hypothetical protein CEXT_117201 [Caerostris extrusa]